MKKILLALCMMGSVSAMSADLTPIDSIDSLIQIGNAGYGGTGCPANTAVVLIQDNDLVILMDKMLLQASRTASFARAACNVRIPIKVAEGYQLVVTGLETEGDYSSSVSDSLTLDQTVNFVGVAAKASRLKLRGSGQLLTRAQTIAVSKCGGDSMLAVSMVGLLRQSQSNLNSYLRLDNSHLKLELRRCN
ncbi:MAG: DUF4360 domain-containing protein [Pseudobdellovibrio sp.]